MNDETFAATLLKIKHLLSANDPDADTLADLSVQLERQATTPVERDLAHRLSRIRHDRNETLAQIHADCDRDVTEALEQVDHDDITEWLEQTWRS